MYAFPDGEEVRDLPRFAGGQRLRLGGIVYLYGRSVPLRFIWMELATL